MSITLHFENPYSSRRAPVMARNMVATSQNVAAVAGLDILRRGGNAADAAVATAIAMTVLEPPGNGIGSDAFCILWDGERLHGLNASGRSPASFEAHHLDFADGAVPRGWGSVTVPGAVSAWVEVSRRFGKLPFEELFGPAIHYAEQGFYVGPLTARAWKVSESTYAAPEYGEFRKNFLPGGRAPRAGERFAYPDQARTLKEIATSNGESFYRGELAEAITREAAAQGAPLAAEDLANHRAEWVGTISQSYRDTELHEIPPNGQGLATLMALGMLEHIGIDTYPLDSADSLHFQIEAMKLALADCYAYLADEEYMRSVTSSDLLDPDYLKARAALIDPEHAGTPEYGKPKEGGTIYLTTADASGMMVSFIQSNYYGFGSGIVVPGTGISLQNRGAGFNLEPGHPNFAQGGKRPFHTIIPAFLTSQGSPLMSFGVMGGPMQAQGHLQMVLRLRDHGQDPQALADAPRWRVHTGLEVAIEEGFSPATYAGLEAKGHKMRTTALGVDWGFGGAQLILRQADGSYIGGSDPRKEGQAVGY